MVTLINTKTYPNHHGYYNNSHGLVRVKAERFKGKTVPCGVKLNTSVAVVTTKTRAWLTLTSSHG